jgi:hypothetical protein
MKTILVQFADARWTKEAVIQACILARNSQARVVVLRLMPVPHASYLGTDFGFLPATPRECRQLDEYRATAEDYGVDLTIEAMESVSSRDALVQAARALAADLLFAYVPPSRAPYWHRFQVWRLHEALGSMLITLDQPITMPRDEPLTIEMITHPPLAGSLPPVR